MCTSKAFAVMRSSRKALEAAKCMLCSSSCCILESRGSSSSRQANVFAASPISAGHMPLKRPVGRKACFLKALHARHAVTAGMAQGDLPACETLNMAYPAQHPALQKAILRSQCAEEHGIELRALPPAGLSACGI